ncbi:MAG: flagellar basal body rod protein FlgC [Candidatus Kapabacteria bacterium]|nr:flagellar basal body rod protein FlgC [Candidatus Kapabacteria bacterium]
MENIFSSFAFSGEGLSVQRQRLSAVAKNIANANTTRDDKGEVYKREVVVVRSKKPPFENILDFTMQMSATERGHTTGGENIKAPDSTTLKTATIADNSPPRLMYDPTHPDANPQGYVSMPNVNVVTEMVEMISAQRAFEANTGVLSAAKNMARDTMDI